MSSVLAEAIEVTDAFPEGVDYKFPRRNLGRGRLLVWLTTCAVLGVVYWMLAGPIARLVLNGLTLGNILSVALWSYLSFLSLRYPLWFCLGLLFGHREVGLQVDSLCTGERIGLLRRNKRCPLERLRRLQIADLLPVVPHEDSGLGPVGGLLHVLTGVLDDGKRIVIAPGYPRSVLDPFVEELSKAFLHRSASTASKYDVKKEDKGQFLLRQVKTRGAEGDEVADTLQAAVHEADQKVIGEARRRPELYGAVTKPLAEPGASHKD